MRMTLSIHYGVPGLPYVYIELLEPGNHRTGSLLWAHVGFGQFISTVGLREGDPHHGFLAISGLFLWV